jgi:integrase
VQTESSIPATRPGSSAAQAVAAYLAELAPNTRRFVLARLRKAAPLLAGPDQTVDWHALDRARLGQLRDELKACGTTPTTIPEHQADELQLARGLPVPNNRPARGRVLPPKAVAALFASCWQDRSATGVRDLALLHGIYDGGLSTAELAGLHLDDYSPAPPMLQVHPARSARYRQVELVRTVPVPGWAKALVDDWARSAGLTSGLVLRRFRKGGWLVYEAGDDGEVRARGMSADAIADVVSTYACPLGWDLAPHNLRRTFAKLARSGQAPLEQIQLALGHQSIQTTQRYLRSDLDLAEAACDRLGIRV